MRSRQSRSTSLRSSCAPTRWLSSDSWMASSRSEFPIAAAKRLRRRAASTLSSLALSDDREYIYYVFRIVCHPENHTKGGTHPMSAEPHPSLSSRRGVAILLLLGLVQFMDVLDASILNIALPSIKRDLGFSQQSLQWVVNGYILTYGGFLLLGGRVADPLGRRRVLVTGLVV